MSQATGGYMGQILILDLSSHSSETISSEPYQKWGGGHGMGSALFWDYCEDKTVSAFDPGNVVTISTSPFSGTGVPSASGRVEIQGIGSFSEPEWFTRSSMGGRVSPTIKAAGYDAVVICGASESPVWVSVINDEVEFHDASDLWGLNTWETQEAIWDEITGSTPDGEWYDIGSGRDGGRTTQKPAVMCIGPASEKLARVGTITHDAAHQAGQSGLGAVWGSKNLKAIGFLGSHSVPVADPAALLDLRIEFQQRFGYNVDDPVYEIPDPDAPVLYGLLTRHPGFNGIYWNTRDMLARPYGCHGCLRHCRRNTSDSIGNGTMCSASVFYYSFADDKKDMIRAGDMLNKMGINGFEEGQLGYLRNLYMMGVLGPGCEIDSNLPFDKIGSWEFFDAYINAIVDRTDIGDAMAEGTVRASKAWGRWEEDSASGLCAYPQWNYIQHYDPRLEVEWSYGSIIGERDINEHGFNWHIYWPPLICAMVGEDPLLSAEELTAQLAAATGLDQMGWNYSSEGIYSDEKIATVAWHRHYGRFWVQSMCMCDWVWPYLVEYANPDGDISGATPEFEPLFYKAVTGLDLTYEDSIDIGHKIFTLDRSIWCLQGRTKEMEVFSEYVYSVPTSTAYPLPVYENGEWSFDDCLGRTLDRDRFEDVKSRFYELEGWDPDTGRPTRETLESLDLSSVADALDEADLEV